MSWCEPNCELATCREIKISTSRYHEGLNWGPPSPLPWWMMVWGPLHNCNTWSHVMMWDRLQACNIQGNQDFCLAVSRGFKLRPLLWWMMVWGLLFTEARSYFIILAQLRLRKLQVATCRLIGISISRSHEGLKQGSRGAVLHSKLSYPEFQKSLAYPTPYLWNNSTCNYGEADDQPNFFPAPPLSLRPRSQLLFFSSSRQSNPRRCWCYWQHRKWNWCCSGPQLSCGRLPFFM